MSGLSKLHFVTFCRYPSLIHSRKAFPIFSFAFYSLATFSPLSLSRYRLISPLPYDFPFYFLPDWRDIRACPLPFLFFIIFYYFRLTFSILSPSELPTRENLPKFLISYPISRFQARFFFHIHFYLFFKLCCYAYDTSHFALRI